MVYQTLYTNVKNRLCQYEEILNFDFFTAFHPQSHLYQEQFSGLPTTYHCKSEIGFQGMFNVGNTYLVVAGYDTVVLLLEPEAAFARNLPFMAVLEGNFFKPYLGCPMELWQTKIEPMTLNAPTPSLGVASLQL
jgi:hypothetical protein